MKDPMVATNRDRPRWAMAALVAYAEVNRIDLEHVYEYIDDLVADLGHLAQKYRRSAGTAFEMYERAIGMFSAENRDPDGNPNENDEVQILAPGRDVERERTKSKSRKSKRTRRDEPELRRSIKCVSSLVVTWTFPRCVRQIHMVLSRYITALFGRRNAKRCQSIGEWF
jgi:hypothetical protein